MKPPTNIFLRRVVDGTKANNLIIVIMEALQNGEGLSFAIVIKKLFCFKVDGVKHSKSIKIGITKQINTNYAPFSIRVHCMAHR